MNAHLDNSTEKLLSSFVSELKTILRNELVGIYIYGSLALGTYNPERSDIDITVLVKDDVNQTHLHLLQRLHKKLIRSRPLMTKLDVNYVPLRLIGKMGEDSIPYARDGKFHSTGGGDVNITMWHILNKKGITLHGTPAPEIIPPIKPEALIENMQYNLKFLENRMPYYVKEGVETTVFGILNLCRVLQTLKSQKIGSKTEAGVWALDYVDLKWQPLIKKAIELYKSNSYSSPDLLLQSQALPFALYIKSISN